MLVASSDSQDLLKEKKNYFLAGGLEILTGFYYRLELCA